MLKVAIKTIDDVKRAGLVLFFALLPLCLPLSAEAFVPKGDHILALMTGKMAGAKSLSVTQVLEIPVKAGQENPAAREIPVAQENPAIKWNPENRVLSGKAYYRFPGLFRSHMAAEGVARDHLFLPEGHATFLDGERVEGVEAAMDRYKELLLYRGRETLSQHLSFRGVDTNVTSLGRFQGEVHFVLGARYPDSGSPQVWVDRNTLLPVRWITGEHNLEIRYRSWRKFRKSWYPGQIAFYVEEALVRRIRVESVAVNRRISGDLFRMEVLEKKQPAEAAPPAAAGGGDL